MVAQEKLKAEGRLAEAKIILGWHFNFCTLTVTLPKQKHITWSSKTQTMIATGRTTKNALKSTIGQHNHVGFVIPWVFHFLSCLRTLLSQASNKEQLLLMRIARTI
jgi:succinate dehydrogenase/fumarate reductase cytochrome b subunit